MHFHFFVRYRKFSDNRKRLLRRRSLQIEHLERRALLAMLPIAPVFHEDAPISVFPVKDQRGFTRSVSESYAHGRATAVTISDGMSLNDREQTSFIVDNSHPGYRETGAWVNSAITGFNGSSTRIAVAANAAATWNAPSLIPGYYSVSFFKVTIPSNSMSASLTVIHNGITEPTQTINLASGTFGFVDIGTYFFSGTPSELIRLSQGTPVGILRADAVRFNRLPNAAPTISAPTSLSVATNAPRVLSAANANAITLADVDAGNAEVQLALTTTNGLLTLSSTAGLTFTVGANGQAAFTVRGTLAILNSSLNGLSYTPNLNYSGNASINLTLNDLGNSGSGGAQTASRSIALVIANTAFIVDNSDASYSDSDVWVNSAITGFNGSSTRIAVAANAAATWNAPSLIPGYYSVSIFKVTIPSNSMSASLTVIHNGITEPTQTINLASGTFGFVDIGTYFFSGTPGELIRLSQGTPVGILRADAVRFNRLSIANATPSIFTPTTQSLTGNTPHIFSTANNNAISVADIDAGIAQVQLALATTNGLLTLPSTVGLAFSSGANGLAAFTVSGTLASLNAALNGLRYSPSLNFSGYASISLTLNDLGNTGLGGVKSAVRSISLSVGSPDFIVDNSDAGYSETVAWVNSALTGFNGSSTRIAGAANAAATWNAPSLAPGYYTVSIYKVAVLSNSASANLTVIHNGITEPMQTINLASGTSGFVEIGTYFFSGAPGELVRLSKGTTVGNLRSDAVRFTLPGFTTFGYGYSSKWGSPVHGTASDVITWTFMNDGTSLHSSHPLSAEVSGLSNISQLRNSIDSTYGNGTFIETIQNAFNTWSAAAPGRINFQYVPTDTGAPGGDSSNPDSYAVDIRIGAFTAVPNSPFSYSAGVGFGPPGDDLNPFYHDALAGDITLNLSVPFFIAPGQEDDVFYTGGVYQNDLEGLMLHELGHAAIGLGHPTFGIGSVMYVDSFPDCCNFINRRLSAADIAGARTVYGFI